MNARWMLLWPLLIGCGDEGGGGGQQGRHDACAPEDGAQEIEIGAGTTGFLSLSDGDEIELVHGPQGGYHLEIGLRGRHLDNSDLNGDGVPEFLAGSLQGYIDGELLANTLPWFDFRCHDKGQDSFGTLLIYAALPEELHLRQTTIMASVTDVSGNMVESEATFLIVDPMLE